MVTTILHFLKVHFSNEMKMLRLLNEHHRNIIMMEKLLEDFLLGQIV